MAEEVRIPVQGDVATVITSTVVGKTRTFGGLEAKEWAFLIVSIINIVAVVALTIWRLVVIFVVEKSPDSPDVTFCILLLINAVFCATYVIHGLLKERQYEIYALIAAIIVVLIYVIVEYSSNVQGRTTIKLVRLVVACVLAPVNVGLAGWVAWQFGWLGFRIVGASELLQRMYKQATLFTCLLKFDLQASFSFVILVLQNGVKVEKLEIVTLAVGLPCCIIWVILGWLSLKKESRVGMVIFGLLGILSPAYVLYKLVKMYWNIYGDMKSIQGKSDIMVLVYSSIAAGGIALLVRAIIYIEAVIVYRNFGKGLKERAFDEGISERTSLLSAPHGRNR